MFKMINHIRARHGLGKLRASWSLLASSGRYAHWMMRADYFGHLSRIAVASKWRAAGETLEWHRGWRLRPRYVVRAWMHSPSHRHVLLSSRFHRIGMGKARGRFAGGRATMWVVHVGSR
jgi:uncharacterized protein YkwD